MTLLVDALACFRLTRLAVADDITAPLRAKLRHAAMRSVDSPGLAAKFDVLLGCPWCVSVYVGAGVVAARRFAPKVWGPLAEGLAFSAITGLIASNLD